MKISKEDINNIVWSLHLRRAYIETGNPVLLAKDAEAAGRPFKALGTEQMRFIVAMSDLSNALLSAEPEDRARMVVEQKDHVIQALLMRCAYIETGNPLMRRQDAIRVGEHKKIVALDDDQESLIRRTEALISMIQQSSMKQSFSAETRPRSKYPF